MHTRYGQLDETKNNNNNNNSAQEARKKKAKTEGLTTRHFDDMTTMEFGMLQIQVVHVVYQEMRGEVDEPMKRS